MVTVRISPQYTVKIPDKLRPSVHAGQEMAISVDRHGRIILTPLQQVRDALKETFGIWADRVDLPKSSVEYVNKIRRGRRLDDMGLRSK
jgi:hypothetical protein